MNIAKRVEFFCIMMKKYLRMKNENYYAFKKEIIT